MTRSFRYDSPENYHLTYSEAPLARQLLSLELVGACFLILVFFPACFWLFSFSEYPGSATGHRLRGGFARLVFLIPLYLRLPLVALAIGAITSAMIAYIVRLGDSRADFLFGPDGVAHIGLFVSKSLLWSDIASLDLVHRQRRYLFLRKRINAGYAAKFVPKQGHSATVRARSKFAALLSIVQTSTIIVNLDAVGMTRDQFEEPMLFLHPGLKINRKDRVFRR